MQNIILDIDHCLIYASFKELQGIELVSRRDFFYLYHRPNLKSFLKCITDQNLNIIFYTSAKKEYAKWIVGTFNLKIPYKLFSRKNTKIKSSEYGDRYLKSIDYLNLNLEPTKTMILDDSPQHWIVTDETLLDIDPWHGEADDNQLKLIMSQIVKKDN